MLYNMDTKFRYPPKPPSKYSNIFKSHLQTSYDSPDVIPENPVNIFSGPLKVFLLISVTFIFIAVYSSITSPKSGKTLQPLMVPSPSGYRGTPNPKVSPSITLRPNDGRNALTGIKLSGSRSGLGVTLNWATDGDSQFGYYVVWSTSPTPVYPGRTGDFFHVITVGDKKTDMVLELVSTFIYYFRVCSNLGGKCGIYSNEVSL